jgi:hypothetical protein
MSTGLSEFTRIEINELNYLDIVKPGMKVVTQTGETCTVKLDTLFHHNLRVNDKSVKNFIKEQGIAYALIEDA